jgi:superkiller protein 3
MNNNLASALMMAERYDEAIAAFRRTLELDANNWAIQRNYGVTLSKAGRFEESIEAFRTALRLNPQAFMLYLDLAKSYTALNQPDKAKAEFDRGLKLAQAAGDAETVHRMNDWLSSNPL